MSRRAPTRAPQLLLTIALVAGVAARAHGGKVSLQVIGGVAAGWSDNILNAPTQVVTNQRGRESDFFFQLAPGAALASAGPRLLQRLAYTFTADLFVRHSEANSFSNTLDWNGFIATSPTTDLLLTLQSQQGRLNTFNLQVPSAGGVVVPALTGATSTNFFSQTASESLTWTPTAQWRGVETTFFRNFIGELGAERIFLRDSLGLLVRADFVDFSAVRDPNTNVVTTSEQQQIITTALARWRRDWSPSWSTEGALGVVEAMNATDGSGRAWQPSVLAAVRWFRDLANAELRYAHDAVPNPLAGSSFAFDEVALTVAAPLGARTHLFVGATAAYLHVRQISAVAGLTDDTASIVQCDVTLGWQPRPEFDLYARYSLFDQFGAPPIDMTTQANLPSIYRNTILIGINVIYPAVAAARVPTRRGSRVDRTDQPGFPEMHQQPPR
jgi:hypothetical protein